MTDQPTLPLEPDLALRNVAAELDMLDAADARLLRARQLLRRAVLGEHQDAVFGPLADAAQELALAADHLEQSLGRARRLGLDLPARLARRER